MPAAKNEGGVELRGLRAKAALYDELVEALTQAEQELERIRDEQPPACGIDPAWRQIASELAGALRPYAMFREQSVRDGRIVVETAVPGATLTAASAALEQIAAQLARESTRAAAMTPGAAHADGAPDPQVEQDPELLAA